MTASRSHKGGGRQLTGRADSSAAMRPHRGPSRIVSPANPLPLTSAESVFVRFTGGSNSYYSLPSGVTNLLESTLSNGAGWRQDASLDAQNVGSGFTLGTEGKVIVGESLVGRLIRVEAQVCIEDDATPDPPIPRLSVRLAGAGVTALGVLTFSESFGLSDSLNPSGGVANHNHRHTGTVYRQVGITKVAESGDEFYVAIYTDSADYRVEQGSSGQRRTWLRAYAI